MAGNILLSLMWGIRGILGGKKVGRELKEQIQVVHSTDDTIYGAHKIGVVTTMVDVLYPIPSAVMAEHQEKDNKLSPILE